MKYERGDRIRMPVRGAFQRADVDEGERTIPFTLSTEGFKRDGINLRADGWVLDHFERNPVMLWAHDPREFPIGRGENVRVEGGALRGVARFTERDENPMGDMAFRLYRGGYLNAVSVGFELRDYEETNDGIMSREHTLEEFSGVPLPLDRDALAAGRADGIDVTPMRDYAMRILDTFQEDDAVRQRAEELWGVTRKKKIYSGPSGPDVSVRIDADTDDAEARFERLTDLTERIRENTEAVREHLEAMRDVPEEFLAQDIQEQQDTKEHEEDDTEVVRITIE